ncbi:MAG: serine hydrolase [Planctomycetota bacterium]
MFCCRVPRRLARVAPALLLLLWAWVACGVPPAKDPPAAASFGVAAADLEELIRTEMADKEIPAVCIAVADGREVVWAHGFGTARSSDGTPARATTVHRVGSISKLLTDVAVMKLAARDAIDLDAPVQRYLPEFAPESPFGTEITLRHLMTHRSGLVREPPVGHYFDPTEPSLAATVGSLSDTALVYEPGTRFKYSNAGLAVAGRVLERISGEPFEGWVEREVLAPLGLEHTSFEPTPAVRSRLAEGTMWNYDGRVFAAPEFALGMGPAANLYSSVVDLVRFAQSWFVRLAPGDARILNEHAMRQMLEPQFDDSRMGLGFFRGELDGHLRVGHNGAMYGFATELAALPEEGFAVAVVATKDFANGTCRRIADHALRWLVARRAGQSLEPLPGTEPVGADAARAWAGRWSDGEVTVRLRARGDDLWLEPPVGFRRRLRRHAGGHVIDDVMGFGAACALDHERQRLHWGERELRRRSDPRPPAPPDAWRGLIGEYGWDHNVLYVLEKDGELRLLIEWLAEYPLWRGASADRFRLGARGFYHGERVVFERNTATGAAVAVTVGGVRFPRRALPGDNGRFRVLPLRTPAELRERAAAARPPVEAGPHRRPDLVELTEDDGLRFDIRYASTNNFLGMQFYPRSTAFLQRPAAEALERVRQRLAPEGLGLLIFDAYRPWFVTKMFWDATPQELRQFVADPSAGSRHNRGCAVDLTLFDLESGEPAEMPSGYDEFTPRAYPHYPGGTSRQRWHRERLRRAMEAEDFSVYEFEWWHFDDRDWREYAIHNSPFRAPGG